MCGLAGFFAINKFEPSGARFQLQKMCDAIAHRGPDNAGFFISQDNIIALGHRRLSILDLSEMGAQPMISKSGRWVIVFNGEIYNHREIRKKLNHDLAQNEWRGSSDTETLIEAVEAWGIKKTLSLCVGMFAIALWDSKKLELTLARDRFGEKPLYFGWIKAKNNKFLVFGSDLNAIKRFDYFNAEVDHNALGQYMRFGYVDDSKSIFKNIKKVAPATFVKISQTTQEVNTDSYWSLQHYIERRRCNSQNSNLVNAIDVIHERLIESVKTQTISDVPIGSFLSGGIDSSLITALLQENSSTPVNTFSIGFKEAEYNEANYARAVAEHLGTKHTELYISPNEIKEIIPRMNDVYSEPFADSSQLPTYLLSKLASKHVKVALSGDAGDEVFCGYNRYQIAHSIWPILRKLPHGARRRLGRFLMTIRPSRWDKISSLLNQSRLGEKMHKLADVMTSKNEYELYENICTEWNSSESVAINCDNAASYGVGSKLPIGLEGAEYMMFCDLLSYLPGDILAKVDRASMAHGLETRTPFLDHRLVEASWDIPLKYKLRNGKSKSILRDILAKYVPTILTDRPKMGFAIPIGTWLRSDLREWTEDLLNEKKLSNDGYLNSKLIRQLWEEHLSKNFNHEKKLWRILMFQSWLDHQKL